MAERSLRTPQASTTCTFSGSERLGWNLPRPVRHVSTTCGRGLSAGKLVPGPTFAALLTVGLGLVL